MRMTTAMAIGVLLAIFTFAASHETEKGKFMARQRQVAEANGEFFDRERAELKWQFHQLMFSDELEGKQ